ncbi:MAG TPA: DUF2087 domain-containing protein [Caldilineaceae bacterium]|nr:DUF2087 domain-containing protein [Caldilineaceae bacterium]
MSTQQPTQELVTPLQLCKVLLNEDRLMILGHLAAQPRRTDELSALLPPRSSAVTKLGRHLQQLEEAGLVSRSSENCWQLAVEQLQMLKRQLLTRPEQQIELAGDDKVLAAFVKQGRLTQLPVQPAKLAVVLRWLAAGFTPQIDYSERSVNDQLAGHEIDYATLRRLLVDHGFLTRQAGVYRRTEMQ